MKSTQEQDEDMFLTKINAPMLYDVRLHRVDESGEPTTNVPHSVVSHSPTGFEWGYGGSGPADLALNILNSFVPPGADGEGPVRCFKGECSSTAWRLHQDFKWHFLGGMSRKGGIIKAEDIRAWIDSNNTQTEAING